ncbi:MAG: hypothetical protein BM485_13575 [Desulfobulbaceae bacterium DB1]|nr:MAG: hypothetical protein BM485_13575 [Desulfobulbaceae bacterium DB1]
MIQRSESSEKITIFYHRLQKSSRCSGKPENFDDGENPGTNGGQRNLLAMWTKKGKKGLL